MTANSMPSSTTGRCWPGSSTRTSARSIELLDVVFDQQHYAFALPSGSPLRKPVSVALLKEVRSPWWGETLYRYLGEKGGQ